MSTMSREAAIATATSFIHQFTRTLADHASAKYNISANDLFPVIKINSSEKRRISRGGTKNLKPWMSICITKVLPGIMNSSVTTNTFKFNEYKHISRDAVIGEIAFCDWQRYLAALLAHEFAHVIQFFSKTQAYIVSQYGVTTADVRRSHGKVWQHIYRDLRINFVNGPAFKFAPKTNSPAITPAPKKVAVAKPAAPKANVKGWRATRHHQGSVCYVTYYDAQDNQIGKLWVRPRYYIQVFVDGKWVSTKFTSVKDARLELFGF